MASIDYQEARKEIIEEMLEKEDIEELSEPKEK